MELVEALCSNYLKGGSAFAVRYCIYTVMKLLEETGCRDLSEWNQLYARGMDSLPPARPQELPGWLEHSVAVLFDYRGRQNAGRQDTSIEKVMDGNVSAFLGMERTEPRTYEYVAAVNEALKLIDADYRDNLYDSVDIYSQAGEYVISASHRAQAYQGFEDKSLVEAFWRGQEEYPSQNMFVVPRMTTGTRTRPVRRVITVYWARTVGRGKKAFVAVSIDTEKLIRYITDSYDGMQGAYLIVDRDNRVILDTTGQRNDQIVELPEDAGIQAATAQVEGRDMRIFWMPMDRFGWKCIQIVPMREFQQSNIQLGRWVLLIFLLGMSAAVFLSYSTTNKLFGPIEAILQLLEDPTGQVLTGDQDGEIQYMLVSILELFQKNMTLEQEMVERVVALRGARAKALQEQMTPHFLNNVLQAINWTAIGETGREDSVTSKSIILLADILSAGKEQKTNITTVAEEIIYTKKFVELECLRFGPGIHCFYQIGSEAEELPIPCISLQTLVENAISHGIQPKGGSGSVYVKIHANDQGGLDICVEDDGVGMGQEVVEQIYAMLEKEYIYVGEHLGLINLFQRFRLIYGEKCQFCLGEGEYGGARVEICTPRLPELWAARKV